MGDLGRRDSKVRLFRGGKGGAMNLILDSGKDGLVWICYTCGYGENGERLKKRLRGCNVMG